MGNVFITSDHHFFHENIIKYENRPFNSVEDMNEQMVQRWNSVVKPNDTVYHAGDFALSKGNQEGFEQVAGIFRRLNGKINLVMGNHDSLSQSRYKQMGFQNVTKNKDGWKLGDFILTHYPILDLPDGVINVHGHTHTKNSYLNQKNHICICVEYTKYTPISLEELMTKIRKLR